MFELTVAENRLERRSSIPPTLREIRFDTGVLPLLIVHTEHKEAESIVVLNSVRSVRSGDSEKGSDNGAKSTVEKAEG